MKIELYERDANKYDGPGIYISGDLTGEIPETMTLRTKDGQVHTKPVPFELAQELENVAAALEIAL